MPTTKPTSTQGTTPAKKRTTTKKTTAKPAAPRVATKSPRETLAVLVDGVRTPFLRSNGAYSPLMSYDLGRIVISGLLDKTGIASEDVEQVIMGTVLHEVNTPNVARESMLGTRLKDTTPANTVSMACISANAAATNACNMIRLGQIDVAIAGGVEFCSDPPLRLSRKLRQSLTRLQKAKSPMDYVKEFSKLKPKDLLPDVPSVTEFSNGLTMGQGCELMVKQIGVTREESDRFTERSHQLAAKAWKDGIIQEHIVAVDVPPKVNAVTQDNGPRADTTMERLATLKPAFDKENGIVTAGSSSFLTDGGSAVLLMSQRKANALKFEAKAIIQDYVYRAGDPTDEMLLGPALAIPDLLQQNKLTVDDIDVWEIHEAFSAQVVANLKCMESDEFAKKRLGHKKAIGPIPLEKMNIWGGSLSLGHPFGATGGRLLTTAAHRLQLDNAKYAVVSGCAAGGHGSAILLVNPNVG